MFKEIRPDNVVMYAMKHYNNPQGDSEKEFLDDMKRFKYIKRLLRKYQDSKELRERKRIMGIFETFHESVKHFT